MLLTKAFKSYNGPLLRHSRLILIGRSLHQYILFYSEYITQFACYKSFSFEIIPECILNNSRNLANSLEVILS